PIDLDRLERLVTDAVRAAVAEALRSVQGGSPLGKSAVLPLSQIKELTGIGWPTLNRYRDSGELAVIWIGGTQYVTLEGWQRFIASRPVSTEAENIVRERLMGKK